MRKIILFLILLFCCAYSYGYGKAATIYSDYNNYECKGHCVDILKSAGYTVDSYENINFADLIKNLSNYDIVVASTLYNYTNTIDISKYGKEIGDYITLGGIFIIVEGVYESGVSWVNKVFPNIKYNYGEPQPGVHEYDKGVLVGKHNPICEGSPLVSVSWGTIKDCEGFNVLWTDRQGIPLVVYAEIGKGILIISSSGPFFQFPNTSIIKGLAKYVQGEKRINDSVKTDPILIEKTNITKESLKLKCLQGQDAADTNVRIYNDDTGIYFDFDCFDSDITNCTSDFGERDNPIWNDDCVEIYLEPKEGDKYYFAVSYNNVVFDELNDDISFNTYFESKVSYDNNKWICNVFIPWTSIGINKDNPTLSLKLNVGRCYHPNKTNYGLYGLAEGLVLYNNLSPVKFEKKPDLSKLIQVAPFDIMTEKIKYGNNKFTLVSREGDTHSNDNAKSLNNFIIKDLTKNRTFKSRGGVCNVNLEEGQHSLIACVTDSTGKYILRTSDILNVQVESILNYDVIYPFYRDIVQSKDPNKNLKIKCSVPFGAYDLIWTLKDDKIIKTIEFPIKEGEVKNIEYDLSGLKEGVYTYTIELKNKDKTESLITKSFEILPPASYEVTFNEKGICYVNGEAFFPNLMYHTTVGILNALKRDEAPALNLKDVIKDVKAHNFNYAHALRSDVDFEHFKDYVEVGLPLVSERNYEMGKPLDTDFYDKLKENYNKYNMGLFYYSVDEPIGDKLDDAIKHYNYLRKLDPHRPVTAAICYPSVFKDAKDAFDIVLPDIYPIKTTNKTPSFNSVLPTMELARSMSGGKKPIWVAPQAFGAHNPKQQFWLPTPQEVKFQPWFYLTQGVTGFFWYAYQSGDVSDETMIYNMFNITQTDLWDLFIDLNKDIDAFSKIIINGDNIGPLKSDNSKIQTCAWICDGKRYAIITNPERESEKVTIEELQGEIKPFFEKDKYTINKGVIELKPLEYMIVEY